MKKNSFIVLMFALSAVSGVRAMEEETPQGSPKNNSFGAELSVIGLAFGFGAMGESVISVFSNLYDQESGQRSVKKALMQTFCGKENVAINAVRAACFAAAISGGGYLAFAGKGEDEDDEGKGKHDGERDGETPGEGSLRGGPADEIDDKLKEEEGEQGGHDSTSGGEGGVSDGGGGEGPRKVGGDPQVVQDPFSCEHRTSPKRCEMCKAKK
ncbi:hypothetical protein ACFLY6_01195 [Candidatus Dependentiae bacterium]